MLRRSQRWCYATHAVGAFSSASNSATALTPLVLRPSRRCSQRWCYATHAVDLVAGGVQAWWLAFFPPERFLIYTSDQLHDKASSLQVRARGPAHLFENCAALRALCAAAP